MVKKTLLVIVLLFFASCEKKNTLKVGHGGGYLSAALYAAQEKLGSQVDIRQFNSLSDVAYSLLLGELDAGFVGVDKLAAFAELDGFDKLTLVGKVTYPYGATLVLRKGF